MQNQCFSRDKASNEKIQNLILLSEIAYVIPRVWPINYLIRS